jgi:hypothetical protein
MMTGLQFQRPLGFSAATRSLPQPQHGFSVDPAQAEAWPKTAPEAAIRSGSKRPRPGVCETPSAKDIDRDRG